MRTGLIAKKSGMTRIFAEDGQHIPVTMLDVSGCVVAGKRTAEKDGYDAVVVGFNSRSKSRLNKAELGYFHKNKMDPRDSLKEFRVDGDQGLEMNAALGADHFQEGQFVDATAVSKGKGFAGAMKRHNFGGMRASHGVSISHRAHGSTGQCQDPGKVFKGKKMAGHMGAEQVTVQNLKVVKVDAQSGLIFVRGAVPGSRGGLVYIKDAVKKTAR